MSDIKKIFLSRVDSTNRFARELLASGDLGENAWISTGDQYSGRGQGGNSWHSAPGMNITGSLIWFPRELDPARQFEISMSVSLALAELLDLFTVDATLKWPNDIYLEDRKVGGILIENDIMGERIMRFIVGIGLNINESEFPASLPNPVSLKAYTGVEYRLDEMTDLMLQLVSSRLSQLDMNFGEGLKSEYISRLFRYRQYAPYTAKGEWLNARITGVDEFGFLELEDELGGKRSYGFREVDYIL